MSSAELLGPSGPLANALSGYEERPSQIAMAEAVERALARDGSLLVQAGTGTGKTLAYLLPALRSGRKVVVSTGTRTLQDQILEHDVPLLEAVLDRPLSVRCLKGLANYVCRRRYEAFRSGAGSVREPRHARSLATLEPWVERTKSGDRAELEALAEDDPLWLEVMSGSETRIGPRCVHYDTCFVTHARREAEEADLVVVNHHLFFADLALRGMRGGGILPPYDAVIFDEAHQVEDTATLFFGVQVSTARVERFVHDAERTLEAARDEAGLRLVRQAIEQAALFFAALPRGEEGARASLDPGVFAADPPKARYLELDTALDAVEQRCRARADDAESIAQLARRAGEIRDDLASIVESGETRRVTWMRRQGRGVVLGATPVEVRELLRQHLFLATPATIWTSATLTTGGDFSFIERRLGVPADTETLAVDSPFDYPTQAALYLPRDLPDPRDATFPERAAKETLALLALTQGGAFVLCTSFRMMHALVARCRPSIPHPVLVQGDAPKSLLLDKFRATENAVLFATASFWEGVDVPGRALRLVVIDKLPFDVPTDPIVRARCEAIREQGGNPFRDYLLPSAALALQQGFGRLIRTRSDRGIVAVLDGRLTTKPYGRVFLKSLPNARRIDDFDALRAFFGEARA